MIEVPDLFFIFLPDNSDLTYQLIRHILLIYKKLSEILVVVSLPLFHNVSTPAPASDMGSTMK